MSKFYDVAFAIRDAYENQCLVSVDAMLKLLDDCEDVDHSRVYGTEHGSYKIGISNYRNSGPIYFTKFRRIMTPFESKIYKLWFYFYDKDNILIAEFYGLDDNEYDINYDNCDDMQLDFEPVTVDRNYL